MKKKVIAALAAVGTSTALAATVFGMSVIQNPVNKYAGTYSIYGVGMNIDTFLTEETDSTQTENDQTDTDSTENVQTVFSVEDLGVSGELTLNKDGTGSFSYGFGDQTDKTDALQWTVDQDGNLKLTVDGEEVNGTIRNGMIDYNMGSIDESLSAFDFYMAGENADTTGFEVVTLTDIIGSIDLDGMCDAVTQYIGEALQNSDITMDLGIRMDSEQLTELASLIG